MLKIFFMIFGAYLFVHSATNLMIFALHGPEVSQQLGLWTDLVIVYHGLMFGMGVTIFRMWDKSDR